MIAKGDIAKKAKPLLVWQCWDSRSSALFCGFCFRPAGSLQAHAALLVPQKEEEKKRKRQRTDKVEVEAEVGGDAAQRHDVIGGGEQQDVKLKRKRLKALQAQNVLPECQESSLGLGNVPEEELRSILLLVPVERSTQSGGGLLRPDELLQLTEEQMKEEIKERKEAADRDGDEGCNAVDIESGGACLCSSGCSEVYCCKQCMLEDWQRGHRLICPGGKGPGSLLHEFFHHARRTSETLAIAAKAIAEILGREQSQNGSLQAAIQLYTNDEEGYGAFEKGLLWQTVNQSSALEADIVDESYGLLTASFIHESGLKPEVFHRMLTIEWFTGLLHLLDNALVPLQLESPLVRYLNFVEQHASEEHQRQALLALGLDATGPAPMAKAILACNSDSGGTMMMTSLSSSSTLTTNPFPMVQLVALVPGLSHIPHSCVPSLQVEAICGGGGGGEGPDDVIQVALVALRSVCADDGMRHHERRLQGIGHCHKHREKDVCLPIAQGAKDDGDDLRNGETIARNGTTKTEQFKGDLHDVTVNVVGDGSGEKATEDAITEVVQVEEKSETGPSSSSSICSVSSSLCGSSSLSAWSISRIQHNQPLAARRRELQRISPFYLLSENSLYKADKNPKIAAPSPTGESRGVGGAVEEREREYPYCSCARCLWEQQSKRDPMRDSLAARGGGGSSIKQDEQRDQTARKKAKKEQKDMQENDEKDESRNNNSNIKNNNSSTTTTNNNSNNTNDDDEEEEEGHDDDVKNHHWSTEKLRSSPSPSLSTTSSLSSLTVNDLLLLAYQAQEEERFDDGIDICLHILEATYRQTTGQEPGDVFHALGVALMGRGNWGLAHAVWRKGVIERPSHLGLALQAAKDSSYVTSCTTTSSSTSNDVKSSSSAALPTSFTCSPEEKTPEWKCVVAGKIYLTTARMIGPEECAQVIEAAEKHASATDSGGWTTSRHYNVPTTDLPVHAVPQLLKWFNGHLPTWTELLAAQFGGESGRYRVHDAFVVKYREHAQRHLPIHQDQSSHSFTIALNSVSSDYEGGGTYFLDLDSCIVPAQGQVLSFLGRLHHGGQAVTKGVRYIVACFWYYDNYTDLSIHQHSDEGDDDDDDGGGGGGEGVDDRMRRVIDILLPRLQDKTTGMIDPGGSGGGIGRKGSGGGNEVLPSNGARKKRRANEDTVEQEDDEHGHTDDRVETEEGNSRADRNVESVSEKKRRWSEVRESSSTSTSTSTSTSEGRLEMTSGATSFTFGFQIDGGEDET